MKTLKLAILAAFVSFVPLAWAQTISNPSFESNNFTIPPGYVSDNGPITGWTAVGDVGLNPAGGFSPRADNGATPQGFNVAFIQVVSSLSNSVTGLIVGVNYRVTFRANSSIAGGGSANPGWSLNGGAEMQFKSSPPVGGLNPYYTNSASFIATATTAPLVIRTHGGGGSLLLDDFTVAIAPLPPTVATLPASRMTNTVATLNGTVNPNATNTFAWFEWGTATLNYQQQTALVAVGSGLVPLAVSNNLIGLTPGNIYHARVVGSNALGVVRGKDIIFGSPAIALNGADPYTNECHFAFTNLASASGSPLAIAGGAYHNLALKSDGTVAAWGKNDRGQRIVPSGLSNVVATAGAGNHSLALKNDGTVVHWGNNTFGENNIPSGLSNVVAIATGYEYSLALKSDGAVVAWGYNGYGQTNIPPGLSNVVAVAGGSEHGLALKSDGTVVAWGDNRYGQTNVPPGLSNVVANAGGGGHSLALKSDGTVVAWGLNSNGQTNVPPGLSNVVAVAGGGNHSLALKSDGMVVAWGNNDSGQTNVPPWLSNVVAIAGGDYHSLALKSDGTVVVWGSNNNGETNVPAGLSSIPFSVSGSVNTNSPGSYLLTYTAPNVIGGIAIATRTVVVSDTLVPVMTMLGNNPFLITNVASLPFVDPGATAVDLCGGNLSVIVSNTVNLKFPGTYAITYRATDASGNTAGTNRVVVVALPPLPGDQNGDGLVSQSELDAVYASYVTNSPWLYLTNVAGLGGTNVTFSLSNSVLGAYTMEYSTNLLNWQAIGPARPRYLFTDTNAPAVPQRYYRLRYP
jgi:hypothetical protein